MTTVYNVWPVMMKRKTLRAYLNCQDDRDWRAMRQLLSDGGYSIQKGQRFHRKADIDSALGMNGSKGNEKQRMLEAARR